MSIVCIYQEFMGTQTETDINAGAGPCFYSVGITPSKLQFLASAAKMKRPGFDARPCMRIRIL